MTIAQIQNLQAFVTRDLADVVNWPQHVRPDPAHKTTGDHAFIMIKTEFNTYTMSVCSAYIEPPAGAPLPCRSLGTVTFDDGAGNKHIVGPKADATYMEIARHIHARELTDALATARREVAEASKEQAGAARTNLATVAGKAKKWGIKVRDGEDDKIAAEASERFAEAAKAAAADKVEADANDQFIAGPQWSPAAANDAARATMADVSAPAGPDAPWLGCPIIFITNPGEQISGMQEIPGHCVQIISDDRISVLMTANNSEPRYADNLPRRGSVDRDGKVHRFNCWDFNPHYARERSRLRHCEEAIEKMADEYNTDRRQITDLASLVDQVITDNKVLTDRLAAIEAAPIFAGNPVPKGKSAKAKDPELV